MIRVAFRVDASIASGSGHVMRCLTLADALVARAIECHFICREQEGCLTQKIAAAGHHVHSLPTVGKASITEKLTAHDHWLGCHWRDDATQTVAILADLAPDWLVVDHYALEARWEKVVRPFCRQLMVIDDLADRAHVCDLLLDQTHLRQASDYAALLPVQCRVLTGSRYALLRPEFAAWRERSLNRRHLSRIGKLLITMGGSDAPNATGKILQALASCKLPSDCEITVVMGSSSPWLSTTHELAAQLPCPTKVLVDTERMAELMSTSDLVIGAAGSTAWERCALGLPTIAITSADNQEKAARALADSGAHWSLGRIENLPVAVIAATLTHAFHDPLSLTRMSRSAAAVCDGLGTHRVVALMLPPSLKLCRATLADAAMLLQWRNHPRVRQHFFDPKEISLEQHTRWLATTLNAPDRTLLIGYADDAPAACLRLDHGEGEAEVSIYLSPEKIGIGLGNAFLHALAEWARTNHPEIGTLKARVRSGNIASERAFAQAGFRPDHLTLTLEL